jgi:hypothetical protein
MSSRRALQQQAAGRLSLSTKEEGAGLRVCARRSHIQVPCASGYAGHWRAKVTLSLSRKRRDYEHMLGAISICAITVEGKMHVKLNVQDH